MLTSRCDTEVLFRSLQRWGIERTLSSLDGMFAFAHWDARARILSCARDRFGEKPFVYHHRPGKTFVFASEMKALFPFAGVPGVDPRALADFLAHGTVPAGDQTFLDSFSRLPPGERLAIGRGGMRIERYWDVDLERRDARPDDELIREFGERLELSVKDRMFADVPLGSSLSGGLDSSSVVCLLGRHTGAGQTTFTARFDGPVDEGRYARMAAERSGATSHDVWPSADGLTADLDRCLWHQEEPFPTASIYAQWKVMELAKQHDVTVLLDGQGADEILAGYPTYFAPYHSDLLRRGALPTLMRQRKRFREDLDRTPPSLPLIAAYAFIPAELRPRALRMALRLRGARSTWASGLFPPELAPTGRARGGSDGSVGLSESLHASLDRGDGLQSLLRYADLNSMAHSREVRLPFLDHSLVEFAFSLPDHLKIDGGLGKVVLRESMRGILPEGIRERKDKIGYEPPQRDWLAEPDVIEWVRAGTESLIADGWLLPRAAEFIQKDPVELWGQPRFRWGIAGRWLRSLDERRAATSATDPFGSVPLGANET